MEHVASTPGRAALSGINTAELDSGIRPQDDLYRHVNGRWINSHEIPADRSIDGSFTHLRDLSEERVRDIIQDLAATSPQPGTVAAKIGDLYRSFMDTDRIEALGLTPLKAQFDLIAQAGTVDQLTEVLGLLGRTGDAGAVGMYVNTDASDPTVYKVHLYQAGLGLPDEAYYREDSHEQVRTQYVAHIERMLDLGQVADAVGLGEISAPDAAARIFDLEKRLASHHWDVVARRDAVKTYNPMSYAQLCDITAGFHWDTVLAALQAPAGSFDQVVVSEPSFMTGFAQMWADEAALDDWKLWMGFHLLSGNAAYLTDQLVQANFDFYGRVLSGAQEVRDRWKRGVSLVESSLGEAVGQEYVARHFPPTHKAGMDELVTNLIEAYRQSIMDLDWMGEQTKAKALVKLDKFTPKIGYPVNWRDYSSLHIDATDLLGNTHRAAAFGLDRELAKIGKPIDRDEWFMTPQTVNAYYNPGMNEIVFPAAILQPPFFDPAADDAVNYGGIGGVIGHEIGHGFDDQGARYDGDGVLQDWWTEDDLEAFQQRTKALIAQYDAFVPKQFTDAGQQGPHVNGALTIGENIGDLGGLSIALKAYRIALAKAGHVAGEGQDILDTAPVLDGLTGVQRVLLGWAQVWQSKARDEEATTRIATDPHSPNEFRCNGVVPNVPEFYQAFEVTPGDALYLPPENRVKIW